MHRYSIDNDHYELILCMILLISTIADLKLTKVALDIFKFVIIDPTILTLTSFLFSTLLCFYGGYYLFDNFIWKWRIMNKIINCPNISGEWEGEIINPQYPPIKTNVEIRQKWSKIIINLNTETTSSQTTTLGFFTQNSKNPKVTYIYYNKVVNSNILRDHGGSAELTYYKDENKLEGFYYTDQKRNNSGKLILRKIEKM